MHPHLLHDSMLNEEQLSSTRKALYTSNLIKYPVSPLSISQRVTELLLELKAEIRLFSIGGDHSCSLPLLQTYLKKHNERTAILHIDAHTDLMEERLGVKYCFATWAYHILEDLQQTSDLIQIGIRASGQSKDYWEKKYGVQQFRMNELGSASEFFDTFKRYLDKNAIKQIYVSNDIDGTDEKYAALCGTPEANGIHPQWLLELFSLIKESPIKVIGSDFMEFAPKVHSEFAEDSMKTSLIYCQKHSRITQRMTMYKYLLYILLISFSSVYSAENLDFQRKPTEIPSLGMKLSLFSNFTAEKREPLKTYYFNISNNAGYEEKNAEAFIVDEAWLLDQLAISYKSPKIDLKIYTPKTLKPKEHIFNGKFITAGSYRYHCKQYHITTLKKENLNLWLKDISPNITVSKFIRQKNIVKHRVYKLSQNDKSKIMYLLLNKNQNFIFEFSPKVKLRNFSTRINSFFSKLNH